MKNRVIKSALFLTVCLLTGTLFGLYTSHYYQESIPEKPDINGLLWPNPRNLQPFTLIDQNNEKFDLDNLSGKWTLLFFGYTHCPDICPITLTVMDRVYRELSGIEQKENFQFVFVSVDPERDTPEKLSAYVHYFNEQFTGLTGSTENLQAITNQLGIVFSHGEDPGDGNYLVDHTGSLFLIAPGHEWLGIFTTPHNPDDIIKRLLDMVNFYNSINA